MMNDPTPTPSKKPPLTFTRQQARDLDQQAINFYGLPGIVLMENAARSVALQAMQMLGWPQKQPATGSVIILCGGGNNGGDGLAAARHLTNQGLRVTLAVVPEATQYHGDAAVQYQVCQKMEIKLCHIPADDPIGSLQRLGPHDLIIDALFGTGLTTNVRSPYDQIIEWINQQVTPILAIDTPSGLDTDTGQPLGQAVKADTTVTFVGLKLGFRQPGADEYTGHIVIADIGLPQPVGRPQTLSST